MSQAAWEKKSPSWRKLVGALRQMGDDRAAEEIVHVSGTHHMLKLNLHVC